MLYVADLLRFTLIKSMAQIIKYLIYMQISPLFLTLAKIVEGKTEKVFLKILNICNL